ncbi:hypothetical protein ANME2D_00709 [Candidatus Methanoperedens nitroreducens]|uniref:Uncharacterized protein n=2 Tax=Candidatus Methanoperedens nitratireducens TaxID=1392998 RepID=A0A062V8L3_9EURY|nr:hypothetical protein ANME2D_00709 [Candidatus Methanoperedens nitroreducens]
MNNPKSIEECVEEIEKTLADVIEEAERKNKDREHMFCPLSKMMCRVDCACYTKATVHGMQSPKPYIMGGYCRAYILQGPAGQ